MYVAPLWVKPPLSAIIIGFWSEWYGTTFTGFSVDSKLNLYLLPTFTPISLVTTPLLCREPGFVILSLLLSMVAVVPPEV